MKAINNGIHKYKRIVVVLVTIVFILCFTIFRSTLLQSKQMILLPFRSFGMISTVDWSCHGKYIAKGLLSNILLFIPFGYALSKYNIERWKVIIPFLVSLTVETIQYFTRLGTFEVDDLICNTIGGILGYELSKQISGQRKGNFIIPGIYLAVLGVCCLKSILFN